MHELRMHISAEQAHSDLAHTHTERETHTHTHHGEDAVGIATLRGRVSCYHTVRLEQFHLCKVHMYVGM